MKLFAIKDKVKYPAAALVFIFEDKQHWISDTGVVIITFHRYLEEFEEL